MEDILRSWLYSLLASGCICSLLLYFHNDSKIKPLLETGCACVMILMFLQPLSNLPDLDSYTIDFEKWTSIESRAVDTLNYAEYAKSIIEEEYSAYILTEAKQMSLSLQHAEVQTEQDDNGCWLPVSVIYKTDDSIPLEFKQHIAKELGISEERQFTNEAYQHTQ